MASSVDGPFEGRSVARTDLDATMTNVVSCTVPASSPALARFRSFSRAEEDGSDEERSRIGHQHVWARVGDSRIEPQELQTVSANVGRGNPSRQNRFNALREDGEVAHTAPNSEPIAVALGADDTDSLPSRSSCVAAADNFSGNGPALHRRLRLVWDPDRNLSPEVRTAATMIRSLANRVFRAAAS